MAANRSRRVSAVYVRLISLLGILCWSGPAGSAVLAPAEVAQAARDRGSVRVIVQIDADSQPEGRLANASAIAGQRAAIASAQQASAAALAGTPHTIGHRYETIPFLAVEVGPEGLAALEAAPGVVGIEPDRLHYTSLAESVPLIGASQLHALGIDGTGSVIAILDTGVDSTHPMLQNKVVFEACFSGNASCPNGQTSMIAAGAGAPCTYAAEGCRHGTHVAGIAAGDDALVGVAPGASLVAIQVFSRFTGFGCLLAGEDPCASAFTSDIVAGLTAVASLKQNGIPVAAANLSLGGSNFVDQASCDAGNAATKAAIDTLRSLDVASVIASGNTSAPGAISTPGCISSAISVGSTTKADGISSFSNSASFLSLLGPGSSIQSSVPGGGTDIFSGTSMATPHVAGAWAILHQVDGAITVDTALQTLQDSGIPILDTRNGITKSRIQVDVAVSALGLECEVAMSQASYSGSETVTVDTLRFLNDGIANVPVHLQLGLDLPDGSQIPLADVGSDGSFLLPSILDLNLGPLSLVTADVLPPGGFAFSCLMSDPATGGVIAEQTGPFDIQ